MKGDWGEGRHICQQFMEEHGTLVGFSMVLMVLHNPKSNPFPGFIEFRDFRRFDICLTVNQIM